MVQEPDPTTRALIRVLWIGKSEARASGGS
ncbi:hypothetical protein EDD25_2851 [Cryobacterium psychrophilum]|nr:hypothetical protein EDD25_2851 [Cryobacterium psychrophilum]